MEANEQFYFYFFILASCAAAGIKKKKKKEKRQKKQNKKNPYSRRWPITICHIFLMDCGLKKEFRAGQGIKLNADGGGGSPN